MACLWIHVKFVLLSLRFEFLFVPGNLLGLAAGPFIVGQLADGFGLATAMRFVPLAALAALVFLYVGRLVYPMSLRMVRTRDVAR